MRKLKAARDRLRPFDRVTSHVPMLNPDTYRIDAKVRKEMARWAYAEIDRPEALRLVARHILLLSSTSVITTFPMFERVRRTEGCRQIEVILGASTELGIQSLPTKWAVLLADIARNHDR